MSQENMVEMKMLQEKVGLLLEMEDIKWRQRAKRNWYTLGDKNTRFFHECANQRRKRNKIVSILDNQSVLREDEEGIAVAFRDHFS